MYANVNSVYIQEVIIDDLGERENTGGIVLTSFYEKLKATKGRLVC